MSWEEMKNENKTVVEEGRPQEFSDDAVDKKIEQARGIKGLCLNALVLGADDTGKSGVVIDYCSKLPKKTLIIDLDKSSKEIVEKFYPANDKLIVVYPFESKITSKDIEIDYQKSMAVIKGYIRYVMRNISEFSAIVLDGLSTLSKLAEYQMRVENCMKVDGDVSPRYWTSREKYFIEVVEYMKAIPGIDKFWIGHSEFIIPKEIEEIDMPEFKKMLSEKFPGDTKRQLGETLKVPQMKRKLHQTAHQRIICRKREENGTTIYTALIDKTKYNPTKKGATIDFLFIKAGKSNWNANEVFGGLK